MPSRLLMVKMLLIPMLLAGCNSEPTPESVKKSSVETLEELVKVLRSIQDEASAEAAKADLKKLSEKFRTVQEQEKKVGEITAEQREELKKYEARTETAMKEMLTEVKRITSDPKLRDALNEMKLN